MPDTYPDLFWGYTAIWVMLIAYVFYLARRVRKLESKLEIKKSLD